ncbi:MAG: neutral zinc metallopeptidase [Pseudomonadota bacterium]
MRWQNQRRSDNVQNKRGQGRRTATGAGSAGLIFMLLRFAFTKFGIGGIVVLVGAYVALQSIGINPISLLSGGAHAPSSQIAKGQAPTTPYDDMVAAVLGGTEDVWADIFREERFEGGAYPRPALNLFSKGVDTACGYAPSAVGPFYCPGDRQIYLDTVFFDELQRKFRVAGDFPPAYVIAHEVGHHVQTVLGISNQVRQYQARASKVDSNKAQVRMELQADCFAGLWANRSQDIILEPGDIEEALTAAAAIGDDALQRQAGAHHIDTDSFTHGSSEQRQRWFNIGYQSGDFDQCDTFSVTDSRL